MKNSKKLSVVINKFPKLLYLLPLWLRDENADFILDASSFSDPVSLLCVAHPDSVTLNLNLPSKEAIEFTSLNLQEDAQVKKGMITISSKAYYMSLCSTFCSSYVIDNSMGMEAIPNVISKQQAN